MTLDAAHVDAHAEGNDASDAALSYDAALDLAGVGRFTTRMTLLCGLGNAADAVELLAVSLVLPAVGPDGRGALRLSLNEMAALSSALFWGALLGTLAWGVLSDALGRRTALAAAMAVSGVFGLLSALTTSFGGLLLCRALAGVGVGGSVPVVFAYLAELLPAAVRGRYMCILAAHWMVGSVATALLGWALVPHAPANGWRAFLAAAAVPSLACALLTWRWAPESPRYLLTQRRHGEALAVLRGIAARNGRPGAIPEGAVLAGASAHHSVVSTLPLGGTGAAVATAARQAVVTLRAALSPPLRATTLRLCFVWFGISFGWYGTVLWFPSYFKERNADVNAPPPAPPLPGAPPPPLDARPFADQLAVALANLPGNALSIYLIDWIGRRATLAASLAAGAVCALAFALVPRSAGGAALAAACAFNGASVGAWNALDCYSAEVMPTAVRTTGLGLMSAAGRGGAICAQFVNARLLRVSLALPLLPGAAVMLSSAALVMWKLPLETRGKALCDDVGDAAAASEAAPAEDEGVELLPRRHDAEA